MEVLMSIYSYISLVTLCTQSMTIPVPPETLQQYIVAHFSLAM